MFSSIPRANHLSVFTVLLAHLPLLSHSLLMLSAHPYTLPTIPADLGVRCPQHSAALRDAEPQQWNAGGNVPASFSSWEQPAGGRDEEKERGRKGVSFLQHFDCWSVAVQRFLLPGQAQEGRDVMSQLMAPCPLSQVLLLSLEPTPQAAQPGRCSPRDGCNSGTH